MKLKQFGYVLSFLIICICIDSNDEILRRLYASNLFSKIQEIGILFANGTLSNAVFLVFAVLCFAYLFRWLYSKRQSIIRLELIAVILFLVLKSDDSIYADTILPCFSYKVVACMMMMMLLVLELSKIIDYTTSQKEPLKTVEHENRHQSLLHVDETNVEDLLNRKKDADILTSYIIKNCNTNHTTGVAVAGEWGSGKTVFLNYLYRSFCNNGITPILFDPWTDKSTDIQSDFFKLLKEKLNDEENFELSSALESYIDSLSVTSANNWFSLLLMTSKYLFKGHRKSVLEQRNHLITMMRMRIKPVAFFIDDCDRLDSESLKDTFSLIRTTADFPNLIIVAAYDTKRVDYLLEKEGGRLFIKKMFNLTHVLPKLTDNVARKFLADNIIDVHRFPVMKTEMQFEQISITNYLPTLRDCKAYLNMLHEDYIPYTGISDRDMLAWSKWLLLELLKFIDRYTYQRIEERPQDFFNVKYVNEVIDEYYVLKKECGLSEDVLSLVNAIMSDSLMKTYFFDIRIPEIYPIYFSSEKLNDFISEDYFRKNIDIPLESRINTLKILLKDNDTNIKQLVSEHIFMENDNCKALSLLVDMLEAYVANMSISSLSDITNRTEYKKYVRVLACHSFLGSLAERIIDNELYIEEGPKSMVHESASVYIESTTHSYAVLAIMADVMKRKDVAAYLGVDEFFIDKLNAITFVSGVIYEDIGWICGDCVAPCLYDKFLTEFLDNHFLDVLPMTMTFNHDESEPYVVARHDGLKALFDTYENYKNFISRWQKEQRFDKDLLKQHYNLVFFTAMLNKDNAGRFSQSLYPALRPYDKSPIFRAPFSSVTISKDFWQNNSRIKHDDEFYFVMDVN